MDRPQVVVYDKHLARVGWLSGWTELHVTLKHNATSTATITLPWNVVEEQRWILAEGARVTIHVADPTENAFTVPRPWVLFTGLVNRPDGLGPSTVGTLTLTVESDFRMLHGLPCWPVPTASLTGQNRAERVLSGPAETVFLTIVRENVTRLGWPVSVPASKGRGPEVTVRVRFETAADTLVPLLEEAGLGVTITQNPWPATDFALTVYEPRTLTTPLTEASEVLRGWGWSRTAPEFTRCVVGGPGEGVERLLILVVNDSAEAAWGRSLGQMEAFVDARDIGSEWSDAVRTEEVAREDLAEKVRELRRTQRAYTVAAELYDDRVRMVNIAQNNVDSAPFDTPQREAAIANRNDAEAAKQRALTARDTALTERTQASDARDAAQTALNNAIELVSTTRTQALAGMEQRGRERLHEANTKAGISVSLSEREDFRTHPNTLWLGDRVPVDTGIGITHTDLIRFVNLSWTSQGYTAQPTLGDRPESKPLGKLVHLMAAIGRWKRKTGVNQ